MNKYKAILFDMDGTLVPMDMKEFTDGYFKLLAKKLSPFNIETQKLIAAVWDGTAAMVKNDGSVKNEKAFWNKFEECTGVSEAVVGETCLEFYGNEFNEAKIFTKENVLAKKAVELAHQKAEHVVLATNPLFPMVGQESRMSWVGLEKEDFELVTSYETDCYCKPNPKYFISVCERIGVKPEECLLVGNDEYEDMYAGECAGLDCYLVTDTAIESDKHPWNGARGTFEEMVQMLERL